MSTSQHFTPEPGMEGNSGQHQVPDEASFIDTIATASFPSVPGTIPFCYHICDGIHIEAGGKNIQTVVIPFNPSAAGTLLLAGGVTGGEQENLVDWSRLDLTSIPEQEFPARILMLSRASCPILPAQEVSSMGNWVGANMVGPLDASQPVRLYAIGPRMEQACFRITHNETCCDVFFDPANDRIIIANESPHRVICKKIHTGRVVEIENNSSAVVTVGEWIFGVDPNEWLMEFKVLGRIPLHISQQPSTKRSAESGVDSAKKARVSDNLSVSRTTTALQEGLSGNPLLALKRGDVVSVGAGESKYELKCLEPIDDQRHSSTWKAEHSKIPGKLVVVKVIKPNSRHRVATVDSIKDWMNEMSIHSSLEPHYAIVPYLGCDARYNAIFTEYVDAKPLIYHVINDEERKFNGNIMRVWRILGDMALALSFLHANGIAHGDIKLGNILFDPVRGAVLIDFNLSFKEWGLAGGEGSPWYLPPEFVDDKDARGPASDMWALGVVTLWLLGHIPMPESTTAWTVEDLHPRGSTNLAVHKKAQGNMEDWLAIVRAGNRKLLKDGGEIADIVNGLVQQEEDNRTNAVTLVEELTRCNLEEDTGSDSEE
ncbi:kinase-like domain-containing protein [Xylaria sp. FL1042]|nr:kinase-like domain-containing protein [Xylaria sp. FL1042]